jgi:hypothetical protein
MAAHHPKLLLLGSLLLGLASATGAGAADRPSIIDEGGAAAFWSPAPGPKVMPGYPSTATDQGEDVCVSIGYLLNRDGSTSDFSLLKSWGANTPDSVKGRGKLTPFAQLGMAAVQRWKFVPAGGGSAEIKPVYTAASFAFSNNAAADKAQIRQHCVISDLSAFITKAQEEAYKRGDLNKGRMDRARNMNQPMIVPRAGGY